MTACGIIKPGTGGVNEAAPSGFLEIARANISAQNGKTISGNVVIYFKENGATDLYVARLEAFDVDTSSFGRLRFRVTAGGQPELDAALKGSSGNQNYSVSISANRPVWNSAAIVDPTVSPPVGGLIYGTASLTSSTSYPP